MDESLNEGLLDNPEVKTTYRKRKLIHLSFLVFTNE